MTTAHHQSYRRDHVRGARTFPSAGLMESYAADAESLEEHHKFMDWLIRRDVIAGSASPVLNGTSREALKQAEVEGGN